MSSKKITNYKSFSSEETRRFGHELAESLIKEARQKSRQTNIARVIAMTGDLGAGKTTFTQGFFYGLGLKKGAQSPTFIIMRRHALKKSKSKKAFKNIFHIDAYRLKKPEHLEMLGFKELAADPKNIILIEWAERAKKIIPKTALWLNFKHGKKENERTIIIKLPR
jgi:tRNA threonylcarbamoyl adenosine modification protein YjeE